jgi:glycosyltransferase involved in cell wall biosynthesis
MSFHAVTVEAAPTAALRLRVLLEMRPAFLGYAGIPQETRLLFRGLSLIEGNCVEGLLQSNDRLLARGLSARGNSRDSALPKDQKLNRLGRVVIALEQGFWDTMPRAIVHTIAMALWHLVGGQLELSRFDPMHFEDFIWNRFFARTLQPEDFGVVTKAGFRIVRVPWIGMHICAMVTRAVGFSLYPRLDTSDFDVMIAETPYPAMVSRNTRLVIRYHDAIPLLMPHTISDRRYHQSWHYRALRLNVQRGAWFVCVSEATRKDLLSIFPQVENRSLTIHNMISQSYFDDASDPDMVREIIRTRLNARIDATLDLDHVRRLLDVNEASTPVEYLLVVATLEPRKNHLTVLGAWERLRVKRYPGLKLIFVGAAGWHFKPIVQKLHPWMRRGDIFLLEDLPAAELRVLYKHARATVCPSFGEGFDFSGVEAMKSGGIALASDIPVHREIYAEAAEYFNPYSVDDVESCIGKAIDPRNDARRAELTRSGALVARRYDPEVILPKWRDFLASISVTRI